MFSLTFMMSLLAVAVVGGVGVGLFMAWIILRIARRIGIHVYVHKI